MKVLVISGGAPGGNAYNMCQHFISALPDGWEAVLLDAGSMDIAHCDGCSSCGGECIHDDDMARVIGEFDTADAVVFATPIRFNGPSSQIKTVLDRFQILWKDPGMAVRKKRFMTYMASSGSGNPDLRPCNTIFRSFCLSFGGVWAEPLVFKGTDSSTEGMLDAAERFAVQFSRTAESTDS